MNEGARYMSKQDPEKLEQEFFTALIEADQAALEKILADDFLLIDVMTGSEVSKAALIEVISSRVFRFDEVNRIDYQLRNYEAVAVITGQTKMTGDVNGRRFEIDSRYTHVFVDLGETWRMVTAQGTKIVAPGAIGG